MGKHLDFYNSCMSNEGALPEIELYDCPNYQVDGLCECAEYKLVDAELLELFMPTDDDLYKLTEDGYPRMYWGDGMPDDNWLERTDQLTPLRQTIVLFMAAINGEL